VRFAIEKRHALDALGVGDLAGVARGKHRVLVIAASGRSLHQRTNVDGSGSHAAI
jgi:hypothetical protein